MGERGKGDVESLRNHLVALLRGGQAFDTFDEIVGSFPASTQGVVPQGAERSAWQILEHMRLSQRDILDYSRNDDGSYVEKEWPDEYWPQEPEPPSSRAWDEAVAAYKSDLGEIEELARTGDLFSEFPWGKGHTLLREILLSAEHSAYHLGQLVLLRELVE